MLRRSATSIVATAIFAACVTATPSPEVLVPGAPLPAVGAAALALRHDGDLRLTDDQRSALQRIQRTVDSINAPLRTRVDSLRPTRRPVNPNDLSVEQREEIRVRREALRGILKQMRENAAPYRGRTLAVLTPEQQAKLAEFEDEERRRESAPREPEG